MSKRLDRYELLYEVGRGGMGTVWAAMLRGKHGFEKLVAIKTILPEFAAEPRFRALLLNEARITAKIEHPNVVQTFELGEHRGSLYVVMEWVEGESLHVLRREMERAGHAFMPLGISLRLVADVCAGLHAAHEMRDEGSGAPASIVHNDISPHNILVTSRGVAKLADFGVAKILQRNTGTTHNSADMASLRGKARYIAPERFAGREDRRSDIWSLGVVLHELLPAEAPGACQRIVQRALAIERERRFGTAFEFGQAIASVMDECQLTTTPADVAAFFESSLRERSAMRRRRVDSTVPMGETLDVVRDLQPPVVISGGTIGGETLPLSRTLAIQDHFTAPVAQPPRGGPSTPRKTRSVWLLAAVVLTAAALLAGIAFLVAPRAESPAPPAASSAPVVGTPPPSVVRPPVVVPSASSADPPAEPKAVPSERRRSAPKASAAPPSDPYDGRY